MFSADGWSDWMNRAPGPRTHLYNPSNRNPSTIRYVVLHDANGGFQFYHPIFDPTRNARWGATCYENPAKLPDQHYSLWDSTPTSSHYLIDYYAFTIEFEDTARLSRPINDWQALCATRIVRDLTAVTGRIFQRIPATAFPIFSPLIPGRGRFIEHHESAAAAGTSTACPSGRMQPAYTAVARENVRARLPGIGRDAT